MKHQVGSSKQSPPGLPVPQGSESTLQIQGDKLWSGLAITGNKDHSIAEGRGKRNFGSAPMSSEELKVRNELEIEVEKDLEEEIKDGICRLALRLHRLYQHQKERGPRFLSINSGENKTEVKNAALTEVNISIRMEGDSKIEVRESSKEISNKGPIRKANLEGKHGKMGSNSSKEFDWVRTLRSSGSSSVAITKKNKGIDRDSETSNNHNVSRSGRNRNFNNEPDDRKRRVPVMHTKILELGWKT